MSRIEPLPIGAVPRLESMLQRMQDGAGYPPNTYLVMQHRPELVGALSELVDAVIGPDSSATVPVELKYLVGIVASQTAGCRYCQANTSVGAVSKGVDSERISAVWEFSTSPLFSAAERVALAFAQAAATVPNAVSDEVFAALREHWTEGQVIEILAVVCLHGFVNRWNDTLATPLPQLSADLAGELLGPSGWHPGKHQEP